MASRKLIGGLSAFVVGLWAVAGVQAQTTPTYSGITYATYSTTPGALVCKLDVYIPTVGTPPYPVLVYVHGGGWSSGSRTATGYVPIDVLAQGIATVAIDYRLTSQAHQFGMVDGSYVPVTWPAQIHDCKAAIRWIRGNAATYGFDANRICAYGTSAGGHLVAAMGTMGGITSYTRGGQTIDMEGTVGDYDSFSSQVQVVCDHYGPTDILNMAPDVTTPPGCVYNFDAADSPSSLLVGSNAYGLGVGQIRANLNNTTAPYPFLSATTLSANPITFMRSGMPPMFIVHGDADNVVPIKQSVRLNNALLASGNVAKYTVVSGGGHGGFGSTVIAATVSWIAGVLKGTLVCPQITTQPLTQMVVPGDTATFGIAATGTGPLSYQWQKNGANVTNGGHYSGCTTATLTISSADSNDATSYRCAATNTCGTIISDAATLTLGSPGPPIITQHPPNQSVNTGGTAVFSVTATGSSPLSYQWQKNSSDLTNGGHYSGCTTATLTVSSADDGDAADYRCVVTNPYDSATSNTAALTITTCSAPVLLNGGFEGGNTGGIGANWTGYTRPTGPAFIGYTISNASPPEGLQYQQIQSSYVATGGAGVYQVVTGCTSGATYRVQGSFRTNSTSGRATVKCAPNGSTSYSNAIDLTPAASTISSAWSTFDGTVTATASSITIFLDGQTHVVVTGDGKVAAFDNITVACALGGGVAPTITQQPGAQSICSAGTTFFSVAAATGDGPLSYQWQKNQANITNGGHYSGTTTTALTVSSADAGDVASYRCVVSNGSGSANSNAANLSLKAATTITQHPQAQSVAAGSTAIFTVAGAGDGTLSYQWQKSGSNVTNSGHYTGCTTTALTVSNADSNDAANYRCVVTAGCGGVTSNQAALTIGPAAVPGDFDHDGDVDLEDFAHLQRCLDTNEAPPADPNCADADLDNDILGAVSREDVYVFLGCMTGSGVAGNPDCAN